MIRRAPIATRTDTLLPSTALFLSKAAYYLTLGANVKAPENGDIRVVLTFYPPDRRQRDRDNLLSNCKASLDGIADSLGVNDSRFVPRSEEHTSELQSLIRISYAVFCLKKTRPKTPKPQKIKIHTI